jgi:hypothetical protein
MTDSVKVLGQIAAAATTVEDLYTTPNLTQTTASTLAICNTSASSINFRVSVHVADENPATPTTKQYLFYDAPIESKSTVTVTIGLTLGELDVLKTYASATGLAFNLFGVETSV